MFSACNSPKYLILFYSRHAKAVFAQEFRRYIKQREEVPGHTIRFADAAHDIHMNSLITVPLMDRAPVGSGSSLIAPLLFA
jgi:hypothetical protein